MPERFRWTIPGQLAGMEKPGSYSDLHDDLLYLVQRGVVHVITLTERPLPEGALTRYGLVPYHLPIVDFSVPTLEQAVALCQHVADALSRDESVVMHCLAGLGRTGTLLAAYQIWKGQSAGQAIQAVRRIEPGYIQSNEQEAFLHELELHLADRR
jgi:atypical dual specificity phosphatase